MAVNDTATRIEKGFKHDVACIVVVVTLFSNIIHEQNTSNTNLTNKAYPGYCKHVLCWRPPEKALAYLAGVHCEIGGTN